jgi:hypothetical protein
MMLLPCYCTHEYQQKKYGNLRVHTPGKSKLKDHVKWRCTVCLSEKEIEKR